MKTTWNDRQGSRDCLAICVIVTMEGDIHSFTGKSIPGVCHGVAVAHEKNGKWSHTTWEITHAETTSVVQFRQDWGTGQTFPQPSWEAGFFWLASQAPTLDREKFEAFIRAGKGGRSTTARWDAAREAEKEFGFSATPEQVAYIREAQARIAEEKAAYEAAEAERMANSPFAALLGLKRG
ncbi:MAG: hypothetical protein KJ558_10240 [Gammaproteobacteria bacterium]|nr:hypothetical protein [Gammaproteobacteria bacterium]MBU1655186.1 hypothetical protein [Gammaproteobacteria bacterium]MBU1959997.1 hypothetical protein [Gammaproteobacteria bacterium]